MDTKPSDGSALYQLYLGFVSAVREETQMFSTLYYPK